MPRSPDRQDQSPRRRPSLAPLVAAFALIAMAAGLLLGVAVNLR